MDEGAIRRTDRSADQKRDDDAAERHTPVGPVEPVEPGKKTYATALVQPLDVTGVRTVVVGTTLWLIAFVALLPFYSTLQDHDRVWWLWTCAAGFGLGLLGLEYCRRRRHRLARQPERAIETSPFGAAGS